MSAAELILEECFRSFCVRPGSELYERDGVVGAMTDVPISFFNGIGTPRIEDGEAIARAVEAFKAHGTPFRWWTASPRLAEELLSHGLTHRWDSPAMSLRLEPRSVPVPDGVAIERITDAEAMKTWIDVLLEGFDIPDESAEIWRSAYANGGFDDAAGWSHFVAYLDEQPIATTSTLLYGELLGIYHVVTLEAARGRGIGKAIMQAALDHGREHGAETAALQSSELGLLLYRSLGFEEDFLLRMYGWTPTSR